MNSVTNNESAEKESFAKVGENDIDDTNSFDRSIKEDVIYEISEKSNFNETRALFIGNLRKPFDHNELKNLLDKYCDLGNCKIERAWLNPKFTHSIVVSSDVPGAESIRKHLNGKRFPTDDEQDGRLPLYVDFIPVKVTQHWIDQENKGPKDAIWKISYAEVPSKKEIGTTFKVATHKMLNYPNETWGYKPSRMRYNNGKRIGYPNTNRQYSANQDHSASHNYRTRSNESSHINRDHSPKR